MDAQVQRVGFFDYQFTELPGFDRPTLGLNLLNHIHSYGYPRRYVHHLSEDAMYDIVDWYDRILVHPLTIDPEFIENLDQDVLVLASHTVLNHWKGAYQEMEKQNLDFACFSDKKKIIRFLSPGILGSGHSHDELYT